MQLTKSSLAALLTALLGSTAAWSQPPEGAQRSFGPWVWGLAGAAVKQFDADLSGSDGQFDVNRAYIQPSFGYAWDRRTSVSVAVGLGYTEYDFSRGASIDGQSPWEDIHDYSLSVPIRFSPHEKASAIVIPSVRTNYERGASADDGRTEGMIAGASWKFSETLSVGPGFGWFSELGGGSTAFPILLIDWQITDKISLSTGRGLAASQGPGLTLNYALNRQWELGLTGRYEQIRFALDEDKSAPQTRYGEDKSVPLLFTVSYTPWPRTSVSALVGVETNGSLRLDDRDGERLYESDFDTTPVIGVAFSSSF
jgi:hypothetical protein